MNFKKQLKQLGDRIATKKLLLLPLFILLQFAISANGRIPVNANSSVILKKEDCGSYKGKKLYKGPKGGCYYINKMETRLMWIEPIAIVNKP